MMPLSNAFNGFGHQNYSTQTNIQPQGLYTPQQTQQWTNQQVAANDRSGLNLYKQFNNPASGFSNGPAQQSQAAGGLAQIAAQNAMIKAQQPTQDRFANAQQMFQGQQAQEQQGLQNIGQLGQQQQLGWNQGLQNMQGAFGLMNLLGFPQYGGMS